MLGLDRSLDDLNAIGGLPHPSEAQSIWQGIWYEETHHSTAIEGNTLILKQVRQLLDEGKAVGNKELKDYLEVQGYAEAAEWVYRQAVGDTAQWSTSGVLNVTEVREIHKLVVESVWRHFPPDDLVAGEGPGSWRKHDIRPFSGGLSPPPFTGLAALMTDWIKHASSAPPPGQHVMEHLADLHASFERIHPFRDGNGRTGRLLINLLLVRHGYPPAVIYKKDRAKYLNALDRADRGDCGALAELLARAVRHSIDRFLLPKLAGDHRLLPLGALETKGFSRLAMQQAIQRGRLRAVQRSGHWYSTRQWIAEYKESRYKRAATD